MLPNQLILITVGIFGLLASRYLPPVPVATDKKFEQNFDQPESTSSSLGKKQGKSHRIRDLPSVLTENSFSIVCIVEAYAA